MYDVSDVNLEKILEINDWEKNDLILAHGPGSYDIPGFTEVVNNPSGVKVFRGMGDCEEYIVINEEGTMTLIEL